MPARSSAAGRTSLRLLSYGEEPGTRPAVGLLAAPARWVSGGIAAHPIAGGHGRSLPARPGHGRVREGTDALNLHGPRASSRMRPRSPSTVSPSSPRSALHHSGRRRPRCCRSSRARPPRAHRGERQHERRRQRRIILGTKSRRPAPSTSPACEVAVFVVAGLLYAGSALVVASIRHRERVRGWITDDDGGGLRGWGSRLPDAPRRGRAYTLVVALVFD